jgi:hypothetical protein
VIERFRAAGFRDYFAASSNADTRRVAAALRAKAIEVRMSRPE